MKKQLMYIKVNKPSGSSVRVLRSEKTIILLGGIKCVSRLTIKAETFFLPSSKLSYQWDLFYRLPLKETPHLSQPMWATGASELDEKYPI